MSRSSIKSLVSLFAIFVFCFAMSACSDQQSIDTLNGTWKSDKETPEIADSIEMTLDVELSDKVILMTTNSGKNATLQYAIKDGTFTFTEKDTDRSLLVAFESNDRLKITDNTENEDSPVRVIYFNRVK